MLKLNLNNRGLRSALLLGAAATIGFAAPAFAQQQQSQGGVETVVVTGSLLSRADVETPSPVTIVTSQQIQASGLTTTADVIHSLAQDNSGSVPTAFGIGFAAGSSGVSLRGMTVNSTLVLINGRRTADYPLADDGHRGFVDLNTIPLDAVDRVEVLNDGASSIYGADAIAGVVNIIMKDEFQGVEGEAEFGTSEQGGGQKERLSARLGYGDMASDHFNAYVDLEYERDQAITADQRGFPYNTNDLTRIGGVDLNGPASIYGAVAPTVLSGDPTNQAAFLTSAYANGDFVNPVTGAVDAPYQILNPNGCGPKAVQRTNYNGYNGTFCEQNFAGQYSDLQPQTERYGVYAHAKERFSNEATFYLDASYFENNTSIETGPPGFGASTPHPLGNISLPAYLATGVRNPNDPFVQKGACPTTGVEGTTNSTTCPDALLAYAAGDIPAGGFENSHVLQATVGLKGDWHGWTYDTAFVAAHSWLNTTNEGFLNYNAILPAIENGLYNFIDPSMNSKAELQALSPDLTKVSTTDEDSWDIRASHDLFALPGGEAQIGGSLEARHEATFDPDLNPGLDAQGLGIAHTIGNRNIYSASAEIDAPILTTVELDLSGRFDHYSDFGDTFNPKAGLKWTPIPQIAFRGTYSTGFRAPSFSENGSSEAEGFTPITANINPALAIAHHNDAYVTQSYGFGYISEANPNIKPETARNFTLGTILTPFSDIDLNGTVDYYNIKKSDPIESPDIPSGIDGAFGLGPIPPGYTIQYDAPDPLYPKAPLRPISYAAEYYNARMEETSGMDINVHFGTDLWDGLHWTANGNYTQIFDYKFQSSVSSPVLNYVGTQAPWNVSDSGGTPRIKWNLANTFTWQDLSVTGTLYYTDGFSEAAPDTTGTRVCDSATAYFYPAGTATNPTAFCHMNDFWDFDLTARYHLTDQFDIFGGVANLFDAKAPLDVNSYGGGSSGDGLNYNPTYGQQGVVGRYYTLGVSFKD